MNTDLLDYFSKWFEANPDLLAECVATVDLSETSSETENHGLHADVAFDEGELLGHIALWSTGKCEMEAFYPSTGNWIFGEDYALNSEAELDAKLRNYFLRLKKLPDAQ